MKPIKLKKEVMEIEVNEPTLVEEQFSVVEEAPVQEVKQFLCQAIEKTETLEGITKLTLVPIKLNNEDGHPDQVYGKIEVQFPAGTFQFGLYEVSVRQL
jgi:hypothetical protein